MTGKTDEIVTYVQQQTDRLAQMIDGKRGSLVEAISAKTNQLTVDIDRVTSDALKSIENRGQTFSQSVLSTGSDVARTITSAGELATGAVGKSLKDLEQASRAAIDQSRQVSVAAVTEMQETSKILRTDTVALVQRLSERKSALESLVTTIDLRTADLDQRLSRFTGLLDESLAAAEERARDIARVVAETAGAGSAAISRQFEAVRSTAEEERRLTAEAMTEIYQQSTQEADAMFTQSAERFANMVASMKQMAAEMHNELEATRNELRRGVLEMPQEAAESTAQMRKVIVDQTEALAELNRIVAHHGRGLDVVTAGRSSSKRAEEPAVAPPGGRGAPRVREGGSASNLPPPDLGLPASRRTEAPPVSAASADQGRDGWLSDLLNRTDAASGENRDVPRGRLPQQASAGNPLESLSLDIGRLLDRNLAVEMWDRYQRGESKAFSKRLYTPAGQKAFDEVARKYRADRGFKQTVDRYIAEFERLLDEVARDERGPQVLRSHLTSDTGLVYTLLAHAAGRLG